MSIVLTNPKSAQLWNRKRDISGDDLRREFWVHEEASSPKKKKKAGEMSFFGIPTPYDNSVWDTLPSSSYFSHNFLEPNPQVEVMT